MPYVQEAGSYRTRKRLRITGLQHSASYYDGFRICYQDTWRGFDESSYYSGGWKTILLKGEDSFTSTNSTKSTQYVTTTELSTSSSTPVMAYAKLGTTWHKVVHNNTQTIFQMVNNPNGIAVDYPEWRWKNTSGMLNLGTFRNTLTASEWNDFIRYLDAMRRGNGYGNSTVNYATSGQILTASYFNSVISAIKTMTSNINIDNVSKGKVVRGMYFIELARALNKLNNPSIEGYDDYWW